MTISHLEGELQRIGQKVEDDLLPHVAVDMDGRRQRRTIDPQAEAGAVDGRTEGRGQLGGEAAEIDRLEARLGLAGFDAGEIEQRVDELQQPNAIAMGHGNQLAVGGPQLVVRFG
jgi:hypothetical protein